jgi:Tfp pilus assembly protein PilF
MVSRSWLGLCVAFLITTASLSQQPNPEIQAEVQQGVQALEQGNFGAAEQHFSHVLTTDPDLVEVRANLGLAYYADRKYSDAVEAFQLALKANPSVRTAQTFLPLALAALDRCKEAIPGDSAESSPRIQI